MENLFLIYINQIGCDYKGRYLYEFIFSDTIKDVDGDDWDLYPASGRPSPPNEIFIKKVGRVECDLKLDLVQNSDTFSVWDAIDGVIKLGWENINDFETYPETRLFFGFGEGFSTVVDKLYERDITIKFNDKIYENK